MLHGLGHSAYVGTDHKLTPATPLSIPHNSMYKFGHLLKANLPCTRCSRYSEKGKKKKKKGDSYFKKTSRQEDLFKGSTCLSAFTLGRQHLNMIYDRGPELSIKGRPSPK